MGNLSNVKVGDKRADGAVCTKVEWVAKSREGFGYFSDNGPTPPPFTAHWNEADRFKSSEEAEWPSAEDWKAVRVVTWKKPKRLNVGSINSEGPAIGGIDLADVAHRPGGNHLPGFSSETKFSSINGVESGQYLPPHKVREVRDILSVIDSHMDCKCGAAMALAVVGSMLIAATGVNRADARPGGEVLNG